MSLDVADGIISFIDILAFEKENDRVHKLIDPSSGGIAPEGHYPDLQTAIREMNSDVYIIEQI